MSNNKLKIIMRLKEELRKNILENGFTKSKINVEVLMQEIIKEIYPVSEGDVVIFPVASNWEMYLMEGKKYIVEKVKDDYIFIIDERGKLHPYRTAKCIKLYVK
jgi:hypothetical protein